ncbi:site-specific integrase [Streptomyces sp. NPDC004546]|uniref:tyrosine-type recombinase/integrase n=1 Tax=Streptomyces sp. NPDC004546 TaxID=3154282 RepID=UPI0033A65EE2
MGRKPNLRSSIYYSEKDGSWHGWVTVGTKPDGSPDRRHRRGKTETEVTEKIRKLENARTAGQVAKPGRPPTVASWMRTWLDTIAPRTAAQHTIDSTYRPKVVHHIIPNIGRHRIDRLEPEHLDALYLKLAESGELSSKTLLMIHQILSRALKMAHRRGLVARNVATLVDAPRHRDKAFEPYSQKQARRLLEASKRRRNGARWSVALALGLRQCEALGMCWSHVDLDEGTVKVFQLQKRRYRHGCDDPQACGTRYHNKKCGPECESHARYCPERTGGDWYFKEPKHEGEDSGPVLDIPPQLLPQLRAQKAAQARERLAAGDRWEDWDLVFARPDGRPIPSRDDWEEWKELAREAGIRESRTHDARHTAATLMLEQGVDIRVVQQILRHSSLSVTKRYAHATRKLTKEAAHRVGDALWGGQ